MSAWSIAGTATRGPASCSSARERVRAAARRTALVVDRDGDVWEVRDRSVVLAWSDSLVSAIRQAEAIAATAGQCRVVIHGGDAAHVLCTRDAG